MVRGAIPGQVYDDSIGGGTTLGDGATTFGTTGVDEVPGAERFMQDAHRVQQTEDLQDFKRRQEGHLIMADGGPLLVMAFGQLYSGQNPSKYKIEGKYDIPVGYKVIIKWDNDEIVFMTKKGNQGPEFQIIYCPKSPVPEDFTIFEWNGNIGEIWDQFLTVVESKEERDIRFFDQGPWRVFGVTRDEVQIALKNHAEARTNVHGILYCADSVNNQPLLEEYMVYLGFDEKIDENFVWLPEEFMQEPLPNHYFQYVQEGRVYWLNAQTNETVWKHPLYEKYRRLLHLARVQKPLPHWKSVAAFRINAMLGSIFKSNLGDDGEIADGQQPLVETVENVLEIARIFLVDIQEKPFLVHVLRRALRHYGHAVKEKRKVKDVDDFRNLMSRYSSLVSQFERARDEETKRVAKMKKCVQCDERDAVLFCDSCRDFFCQSCFDRLHARGRRQNHKRTLVEMGMCSECDDFVAMFHCVQCADLYCRDCFQMWHAKGGRRNHIPIVLRSFNSQTDKLAEATPAMGTGSARIVKQAYSPWFCFTDENNIKLYYNIKTSECRRDKPLDMINEPIEENKGGGLSAAWAGTWGANMYPDLQEQKTLPRFSTETAL